MEAFVDKVQGRVPQTWVEPEDTINNMRWIEAIYEKVPALTSLPVLFQLDIPTQDGFGSRPRSEYVYRDDDKD